MKTGNQGKAQRVATEDAVKAEAERVAAEEAAKAEAERVAAEEAARLAVTELSAITARVGTLTSRSPAGGAGFVLNDGGYLIYAPNNVLAVEIVI